MLWQIGTVGNVAAAAEARPSGLAVLVDVLLELYPRDHEVVVYEASPYPGFDPRSSARCRSVELAPEHVTAMSTLYVPPLRRARRDVTMLDRLGLREA